MSHDKSNASTALLAQRIWNGSLELDELPMAKRTEVQQYIADWEKQQAEADSIAQSEQKTRKGKPRGKARKTDTVSHSTRGEKG